MYKGFILLLLPAFIFADLVLDINDEIDEAIADYNRYVKATGQQMITIPWYRIANISIYDGIKMETDSLIRTENCSYILSEKDLSFTYDLHFGENPLVLTMNYVEYDGENQTVVVKVIENSLHMKYTCYTEFECNITVDDLSIERFRGIEVLSSRGEYDKGAVESFFENTVFPELNKLVKRDYWPLLQEDLTQSCTRPQQLSVDHKQVLNSLFNTWK